MDFTENPDESKWRSKHKSIKGVLKEVSDVKSAICKSFRAYEKKRKYLASGKYDRDVILTAPVFHGTQFQPILLRASDWAAGLDTMKSFLKFWIITV